MGVGGTRRKYFLESLFSFPLLVPCILEILSYVIPCRGSERFHYKNQSFKSQKTLGMPPCLTSLQNLLENSVCFEETLVWYISSWAFPLYTLSMEFLLIIVQLHIKLFLNCICNFPTWQQFSEMLYKKIPSKKHHCTSSCLFQPRLAKMS